jgi:hypothetical protein
MAHTFAELKDAVEGYFRGVETQRRRAIQIFSAVRERVVARDVPPNDVWFQSPGTEDEQEGWTVRQALDHFPTQNNEWNVDLVVLIRAEPNSYTRFYNPLSIKFDSPTGTARLFLGDAEVGRTEADSSPTNQDALARLCDELFQSMIKSYEPGSTQRRTIGFTNV